MLQMKTEMGKEVCLFKMMSVIASVNCRGANVKSDSWATVKDTHTRCVLGSGMQLKTRETELNLGFVGF
jgi:hypothetical protein